MTDAAKVLIAANPKSGASESRNKLTALCDHLRSLDFECEILDSLPQVQQSTRKLLDLGQLRAVVAAGGDGTADALVNLLPAAAPILPFPLGTENLLAKHFGFTTDIERAGQSIQLGHSMKIDAGNANGQLFLVMASCGFDAEVVRQMHSVRRGHINRLSYTTPILRALRRYPFPDLHVRDGVSEPKHMESAAWVFVFNIPRYAASLDFCPQADPLDSLLDVCIFERPGIWFGLGYLSRLFLRSHQSMQGFKHFRSRALTISSAGRQQDVPYQLDGDPGGILPLQIEVVPKRVTLLKP